MTHKGTKRLETEKLILRRYALNDAYEYACVDSADDYVLWEPPFSDEQTAKLTEIIGKYANPSFYYWAVSEKVSAKIVGGILTINANEEMLSCEVAYTINPKFRNKGYASEALKRVLRFLLAEVGYNRIQAGHLADNPASGRVMEKAGMKYEGTLRQDNRNSRGLLTDSKIYGILRQDLLITQKLIIITGSPCVGKTAVAEALFESYENSAYFDGDWAWCVNPFSIADPRLRNGDKSMSFTLSTYLNSNFDYIIFSSVVVIGKEIRESILKDITAKNYMTVAFTLKCSEKTLIERHKKRGDKSDVSFHWLGIAPHYGDYVIDTDNKTVSQIVFEMKNIINSISPLIQQEELYDSH